MLQRKISSAAGAAAAAVAVLIALPAFSSGATVKSDLNSFTPAQSQQRAPTATPKTTPPLHGTNPHGQGAVAVVDLAPSAERPFTVDAEGDNESEDVVVGRARGEQRADGSYHGHITIASLFGNEILSGADTVAGQSVDRDIGQGLLTGPGSLCAATGICLQAVRVTSVTTANGSTNRFNLLSATIGPATGGLPVGSPSLSIGAATSNGNISAGATCQTAVGDSNVADVRAGAATANVATSSSTTMACRDQNPVQTNTSSVVNLGTTPLALPPVLVTGCANGTPDSEGGIPVVLEIVCNADDSSTTGATQATDPYGVRNALDLYVLAVGQAALAKVTTSSSESLARAPAAAAVVTPPATTTTTTTPAAAPPAATPAATPPAATPAATPPAATPPAAAPVPAGSDEAPAADPAGGSGDADPGAGDGGDTECSDGVDNDGDGKVDFPDDPGCSSAADDSEFNGAVKLGKGKQLPFTGTDTLILGLAGALLLAAGLALRGPSRRRELGS